MNKKHRRTRQKGTSMVEIIISVFYLTLLASFIVSGIVQGARLMASTKAVSTQAYLVLGETEYAIFELKQKLSERPIESDVTDMLESYPMFSLAVEGIPLEITDVDTDGRRFNNFVVVGRDQTDPIPVPEAENLSFVYTDYRYGNSNPNYVYGFGEGKLTIEYDEEVPTGVIPGIATHRWYVSENSYPLWYSPYLMGIEEIPKPSRPQDFRMIGTSVLAQSIEINSSYTGKQLYVTVTPSSANSGKMGASVYSDMVVVSALPAVRPDDLVLHYDASVSAVLEVSGMDVQRWENMARDSGNAVPHGGGAVWVQPGQANGYRYAKCVLTRSNMRVDSLDVDSLSEYTIFVVAEGDSSSLLLSNDSWQLGIRSFQVNGSQVENNFASGSIDIVVAGTSDDGMLYHTLNGATGGGEAQTAGSINLQNMLIGDLNSENLIINEIIVYSSSLSTEEIGQITTYLSGKY